MEKHKWTRAEIDAYRKERGSGFYFNREDRNLFVPKAYSFGRTLNWANPISWVFLAALAAFLVWRLAFH